MSDLPLVSVIMGTYNCENTVGRAIESILDQDYSHFEFIICDDGSTDNTWNVLKFFWKKDSRIILVRNEKNCKLSKTLNECLKNARGEYVARMDGDDFCDKNRLSKQVAFLESHENFDIVSSWMNLLDKSGNIWNVQKTPEYPSIEDIVKGTAICHAASMVRMDALSEVHGYRVSNSVERVEDVDLWIRMYESGFYCYNIQEALYSMLNTDFSYVKRKYRYRVNSTMVRLTACIRFRLGFGSWICAFRPMLYGLVPGRVRFWLRKKSFKGSC